MARYAMLLVFVAAIVVAFVPGTVIHLIGLGVWWFGALVVIDLFIGGGLPAQVLWGLGAAAAAWAYTSGQAESMATDGHGLLALAIGTALLQVLSLVRARRTATRRPGPVGAGAPPTEPVPAPDPRQEVARVLAVMAGHVERAAADRADGAAELASLLGRYRSRHGTDTIATSSRPAVVRGAVTDLARGMEAVLRRQSADAPGHAHVVLAARYADLLVDLVHGRTGE